MPEGGQPGRAGASALGATLGTMTEHDGFEHVLPNGDILIVESTIRDERVEQAFAAVREHLRDRARMAYEQLQAPA